LGLYGCAEKTVETATDFSFSLTWDCYGLSSYDSTTGELIKTKDTENPQKYITTYYLTEEEKNDVYNLILKMKPENYPDEYNPFKRQISFPSRDIILTVKYNGITKTISCNEITLEGEATDKKGRNFMNVHDKIVDILTSSDEWKALPDYEFYYD
jgi:hypothetical protein